MGATKNSAKTAHVMGLISGGTKDRILPAQRDGTQPRDIEVITREILDAKRTGGEAILTIGRGLMEAKAQLSHGEWLPWLENRVEFSEKSAQNFIRIARNYSNPQALADLGATKALMLLAVPEAERDEFISGPHLVNGEEKNVIDMSARELQAALKERDAALKAAEQAKADQKAADEAREKLSADMALANERIAGLNAEVEAHSAKAKVAQEAAVRLEKELEELRSRPVDVAVETDTAAIEAARQETEERMQVKLDEAKKAKTLAENARKEAERDLEIVQEALKKAAAEKDALRAQAEAARKKAAVTTDPDLVLFSELLDQAQTLVKRMGGVRLKKQDKDPEAAGRLQAALMALIPVVKEAAGQ